MSEARSDRCPICGGDNSCTVITDEVSGEPESCADCWCQSRSFSATLLERVPDELRDAACICRRCSNAADREAAEGVTFTVDPGGRPAVRLQHEGDDALIALAGAQLLSWRSADEEIFWTAGAPEYVDRQPVRGGVPVVFPWFGDHPDDRDKPAHGFARSCDWQVVSTAPSAVTLALRDDPATLAAWPHEFSLELHVALSEALHIRLTTHNPAEHAVTFEQALHTYFDVGDVRAASISGLEGVPVTEHASRPERAWDRYAPLRFRSETDRVFQGAPAEIALQAPALRREVRLETQDAASAIVWNPWPEKAARLSQMNADDWQSFCCVETANCKENAVTLEAGARHQMTLTLRRAQR